jgi:hypothetical protein
MEILKLSTHDLIEYLHAISRRNSKSFSSAEHDHLDKQEAVALHALREALNRNDA